MTSIARTLTGALVALLALAGAAAAQGTLDTSNDAALDDLSATTDSHADDSSATGAAALDAAEGAAEGGAALDSVTRTGSLHAEGATDHARGAVTADGGMSDPEDAADGGFWAWLEVSFGAFVANIADMLGFDAEADVDARLAADLAAVDTTLDVPCMGLPEVPCGDVDVKAEAERVVGNARALVTELPG